MILHYHFLRFDMMVFFIGIYYSTTPPRMQQHQEEFGLITGDVVTRPRKN